MSATTVPIRPLARGSVLKLWLGILFLALIAAGIAWLGTAGQQRDTLPSGVQLQVIEPGEGPTVTPADLAALRYRLYHDGELLQDSDQAGQGQPFVTSTEGLFPGFSQGLQRMQAGGRYRLWLPPGQHVQPGQIPPGAPFTADDTLMFEIEVLQIAPGMAAMQRMMGPQGQGAPGAAPGSAPGAAPGGAPAGSAPPTGSDPAASVPPPPAPDDSGRGRNRSNGN